MISIDRDLRCNIRFNCNNSRHIKAANYLNMIPPRKKVSFIVHLIEQYIESHPYGPNWDEIEKIGKLSNTSYPPKASIVENMKNENISDKPSISNSDNLPSTPVETIEVYVEDTCTNTDFSEDIDPDILRDMQILGIE